MSPQKQIETFAQSIYLVIKNRYYDEIEGEDGQVYVSQVMDHTNMYLDELDNVVDPSNGELVDWWFNRSTDFDLGTATQGGASITTPSGIERLLTDEGRYVQISQDGLVVSNWAVVSPKHITNRTDRVTEDMCAVVGSNIVFSRAFRDTENDGDITGDVILKIPRLLTTNAKALTQVMPKQLLILGVAKNITLSDIVQGKLSPSFVQKYNDLLTGAIARSMSTSLSPIAERETFGHIGGV